MKLFTFHYPHHILAHPSREKNPPRLKKNKPLSNNCNCLGSYGLGPKLPHLASTNHTNHPLPCVSAELGQRLHRVNDEIGEPCDCFLPAAVDCGAFTVYSDEVVG